MNPEDDCDDERIQIAEEDQLRKEAAKREREIRLLVMQDILFLPSHEITRLLNNSNDLTEGVRVIARVYDALIDFPVPPKEGTP